jgi:hypothetical protein
MVVMGSTRGTEGYGYQQTCSDSYDGPAYLSYQCYDVLGSMLSRIQREEP